MNNNQLFTNCLDLEEVYSLEDYESAMNYNSQSYYINYNINYNINKSLFIRIIFEIGNKQKEFIVEKKNINKVYIFIKICDNENENKNYIYFLINKNDVYDPSKILNKINNNCQLKGAIKLNLKMDFPIINYSLKEVPISNDNFEDKKYILIKNRLMDDNNSAFNNNINNNINYNYNLNNINSFVHNINQFNNNFLNMNNQPNPFNNNCQFNNINPNFINTNFQMNDNLNNMNQNNNNLNNNIIDDLSIFNRKSEEIQNIFPLMGLNNVGLNSYMNSTLQCLLHIPELNYYFINIYPIRKDNFFNINNTETGGLLSKEYYKVVQFVCKDLVNSNSNESNSFSPEDFNYSLCRLNPQISKNEENDSRDLLLYLIKSMHKELNYLGDKKIKEIPRCNQLIEQESFNIFDEINIKLNCSIISYLFYGIIKSTSICSQCNSIFYDFKTLQILNFPLNNFHNKIFNIYQGFKEYIKTEIKNFYCKQCKDSRDAKIRSIIFAAPPYLIINLDYGKNKEYNPKKIAFGEIIDLTDFIDYKNSFERTYKLIAVNSHIGISGNNGHYISYCKSSYNKWYKYNDSRVNECAFEEVNSNSPYILIFKKMSKISN